MYSSAKKICGKYVGNIMKKYVALGIERAKRVASCHIYLSPYINLVELGRDSEGSLEARLERHETCSLFFSLVNKS